MTAREAAGQPAAHARTARGAAARARRGSPAPGSRVQLKRALSKLGLCSRAQAEALVRSGRVRLNGRPAADPLVWVDLSRDRIESLGPSGPQPPHPRRGAPLLILLNKPRGFVTTRSDERGRATVYDLLPAPLRERWLFPVGRLDRDTEGLLLFTDDGPLADRLTDPGSHLPKTYRALLQRELTGEELARFERGLPLDGVPTRPARILAEGKRWYRLTLTEGRNRQVRRMLRALGNRVRRLVRVAVGGLELGDLPPGGWRRLRPEDRERLGLAPPPRCATMRGESPGFRREGRLPR